MDSKEIYKFINRILNGMFVLQLFMPSDYLGSIS